MNFIQKVRIENFQSHIETELEFDKGLNVIVGPSDHGKSAIIRAIKWVLFNEPRGSDFIRHNTKSAKVTLYMSNGYVIMRERTPSKNRYLLTDKDNETTIYEGMGNDVPEEVKKAHGIYKVLIDVDSGVSLNIGEQLESAFLLSSSDSTKAKAIGRLTGVHIIDNAVRQTLSDLKRENQNESKMSKELETTQELLKQFEKLEDLKNKINIREEKIKRFELLVNKFNKIKNLFEYLKEVEIQIINCKNIMKKYENLFVVEQKIFNITERNMICNRLKSLNNKLNSVENDIKNQRTFLDKTENVHIADELIKNLEKNKNKLFQIQKVNIQYKDLINKLNDGNKYIKNLNIDIEKDISEYETILKNLGKCPVCFSNIDKCVIENIIKNI